MDQVCIGAHKVTRSSKISSTPFFGPTAGQTCQLGIQKVFGTWNPGCCMEGPSGRVSHTACSNKWEMASLPFYEWLEHTMKNGLRAFIELCRSILSAAGNNLDEDGERLKREGHLPKLDKLAGGSALGLCDPRRPVCEHQFLHQVRGRYPHLAQAAE